MLWFALACSSSQPTPTPRVPVSSGEGRLVRLTHHQWENTVVDLLGLRSPTGLSDAFVPDGAGSTFDNDGDFLFVNPTLWQQYQSAAETLAQQVVSDPVLFGATLDQDAQPLGVPAGAGKRDAWLNAFGRRAFRRPLVSSELRSAGALFDAGADIFGSGDPFVDGIHASVAGFLQSPGLLYRTEGVNGIPVEGGELSSYELAAKLSYALWNTIPDEELQAAAGGGLHGATFEREVDRMLAAPAAHAMVADLHRQLLHVDGYENIYRPSEEVLGIGVFEGSTPAAMQREVYAFVDDVVFGGGTVRDLLTSSRTFVNDRLADIYGIDGIEGDELVPVQLEPSERAGLLTLSGFLAWEADRTEPKLIERGAFVNEAILCVDVPPPPPNVPALPPDDSATTLRERIEGHTEACGGACHVQLINPIGFAFGHYDHEGRLVDEENGLPIDATGTYRFEDGELSYDGAVELAWILADRVEVHRCYVSHLVAYLEGRSPTVEDQVRIEDLTAASMEGEPILGLITDIITAPPFRDVRR